MVPEKWFDCSSISKAIRKNAGVQNRVLPNYNKAQQSKTDVHYSLKFRNWKMYNSFDIGLYL